jgi:hypothetical protein
MTRIESGCPAPFTTSFAIAAGSSERALSVVTTTTSASSLATAPITGRFVASRSPPQPKTTISLAPVASVDRAADKTARSESGVWA